MPVVAATAHSPLSVSIPSIAVATDDWPQRIAGSIFSTRLNTTTDISTYTFADAQAGNVSFDSTLFPTGSSGGSGKIAVLNADSANNGAFKIPWGTNISNGQSFWVSFRCYAPPELCYQEWPTGGLGVSGHKLAIISDAVQSHETWEVVWQCNNNRNRIAGYYDPGANPIDSSASTPCSGSDFRQQPAIDNGANPLTGTNPDTGAAWSSCEQARAEFGPLYSAQNTPAANYQTGLGDPWDGGFRQYPNEWITCTARVQIGTFGTANARLTLYAARSGQAYVMLADKLAIDIGNVADGPYNALWLLPYTTNRVPGGAKISARTNNITGVTLHTCGLGTTLGAGTLEYNASTQRFRWHGSGETFGSTRGFSSANGLLRLNVESTTADSFITLTVNPGSLPGAGTITDTVTIANGRPDTQINYADVIVSFNPILAPGGFAATALGQVVHDMTAGSYATVTTSGQQSAWTSLDNPDAAQAATGYTAPFAVSLTWDKISQRMRFLGSDHYHSGTAEHVKRVEYDDITNTWTGDYSTGATGHPNWGGYTVSHGYDYQAIDEAGRHYYCKHVYAGDTHTTRRLFVDTNTWDTLPDNTLVSFASEEGGHKFIPGYGLVWYLPEGAGAGTFPGDVYRFNEGNQTWSKIASAITMGSNDVQGCYSPVSNKVYFGGGAGQLLMYSMDNTGTLVSLANAPIDFSNSTGNMALFAASPINPYLYLWAHDGSMWRYSIGGDSWTQIEAAGTNSFFPLFDNTESNVYGCLVATCNTYGVILVPKYNGASSKFYVFKEP